MIIRTISCRSLINSSEQLWVHGKLGKLDGRWRVFHTFLLPSLHSLSYCIVIIKDFTKTAFSPKAQVYMRAHTWSCSSSPLDKCMMVSILIHSPEVLGTSSSSHHCLSQNITVGITQHIHRLFIVASFTFGEPLPVRMTHIENTHAEARETLMQRALVRVQKDSHFGRQFDSFSGA